MDTWQVAPELDNALVPLPPLEKLMKPADMAELLGVSDDMVYQLVREQKLTCVRVSERIIRFRRSDYEQFIRSED
jgi:excisionase family DNA binding protein